VDYSGVNGQFVLLECWDVILGIRFKDGVRKWIWLDIYNPEEGSSSV
jgi:hypothetical protein